MDRFISSGRWKQVRGQVSKLWGKLTHDPFLEFHGELVRVEGRIEEFHARKNGGSRGAPRPVRTLIRYPGRRRGNAVA